MPQAFFAKRHFGYFVGMIDYLIVEPALMLFSA